MKRAETSGASIALTTSLPRRSTAVAAQGRVLFELGQEHLEAARDIGRIERRVALRTPHHLSLPAIIEATDLVATVSPATASRYADEGLVRLVAQPFAPPVFEDRQSCHVRTHDEARMR